MSCPFCKKGKSKDINDTVLYENDFFIIIPAKGPLVAGHILIVSKKHDSSLLCVDFSQKLSFTSIVNTIINANDFYKDFLIFEHGSFRDDLGGKTIDHTHIHVLPNLNGYKKILENDYELKIKMQITNIPYTELHFPYLLIGDKEEVYVYDGKNVKSQIIRIKIAETNKYLIPYWQDFDNLSAVKETIKMWSNVEF